MKYCDYCDRPMPNAKRAKKYCSSRCRQHMYRLAKEQRAKMQAYIDRVQSTMF